MPALPDVADVLRVEMDFTVGTDARALTRWYQSYTGTPPAASDVAAFAGEVFSAFAGPGVAVIHTDTIQTEVRVTDLSSATGAQGTASGTSTGTRSGTALGAGVAFLHNGHVGRRWRGGKPRGYWPFGVSADLLTRQTWTSASLTDFESVATAMLQSLSAFSSGGTTCGGPVNVSYYGPPNRIITGSTGRVRTVSTVRVTPLVDFITAFSGNPNLASQRRRNLIRG